MQKLFKFEKNNKIYNSVGINNVSGIYLKQNNNNIFEKKNKIMWH
jgi:hypothetical protein